MAEKSDRFCALVAGRQKEKNISYAEALLEVSRDYPGLCEEYRAETTGRRPRYEMIGPHKVQVITSGAEKELHELVCARMTEKDIGYGVALREVAREHPDLWEIARLQVLNDHVCKYLGRG